MPKGVYKRNVPRLGDLLRIEAPAPPDQWEVVRVSFASKIIETNGILSPPVGWEPFAVDQGWLYLRRMKE